LSIASRTNSWWGAMRLIRLLRVVTDISETTVSDHVKKRAS
jgi:hypothetical protein